jgi:hypothetical protein
MQRPQISAVTLALLGALALPATAQEAMVLSAETGAAPETVVVEPVESETQRPEGLQVLDATDLELAEFLWVSRIVAVLADTPNDPAFIQQMREIEGRAADLLERDVVVIIDTDPRGRSDLRQTLRARGFMLAIIEKDGTIAQRRPAPRDVREINAIIDRFPLRRQEMLERRPAGR